MSVVELPRADTPPQEPQGEHQAEAGPSTPQKDLPPAPDDPGSNSPPPSPSSLHTQQDQSRTASNEDVTNPPPSAQVPTTSLASQTDTSIPSSSTHPSTTLNNTVESKEVDEGSWSPSILTVPVKGRARRKSGKAATNGKGTLSSTAEPPSTPTSSEGKQSTKRRKISFFKRISFICASCVSSSPRTHDVDIEEGPSRESEQRDPEKQPSKETETAEHPTQEPSSSSNNTMIPSTQALTVATATLTPSDDIAIVVPPTPTRQLLPLDETDGLTSGAVQPPGSTGEIKQDVRITVGESEDSDGSEDDAFVDGHQVEEWEDEEQRLIRQGGTGIPVGPDGTPQPLLPSLSPKYAGRKCLVLDLDETLVHSSLRPVPAPDYIVPVEIENNWHNFYVLKRPGVDNFLKKMGELYEVVVFTASLSKYADPVLDRLDPGMTVAHRLFRESCYNHRGNYVKDLSQLGRPISDTIILDNSPASYIFHPHNAVPVSSWFNDPHDTELTDLCPFLEDLSTASDVRGILNPFVQHS